MRVGRRSAPVVMVLTVAFAVAPGAGSASAAPCKNEGTPRPLLGARSFERAVVCVVNRHRASHRRRPVRTNRQLGRVASRYAARMVWEGFFAHRSPDGSSILSRLVNSGYLEDAAQWAIGENLSWASGGDTSPAAIVHGWMVSPSHRKNMLRPVFREIGVGVTFGTPFAPTDPISVTVASEYGVARTGGGRRDRRKGRNGRPR